MQDFKYKPEFPVSPELRARARCVDMLILDVDGVLTDGRLYFSDESTQYKSFHSRDGLGLKLLQRYDVTIAIITSRTSNTVAIRARELGIRHLHQGARDKLAAFELLIEETGGAPQRTGYIGDDLVDLPIMQKVNLAVAVSDAHPVVRSIAHWVTPLPGGMGAARQVCDLILFSKNRYDEAVSSYMTQ